MRERESSQKLQFNQASFSPHMICTVHSTVWSNRIVFWSNWNRIKIESYRMIFGPLLIEIESNRIPFDLTALQSTEATPCGHLLKWRLTPGNPPADTMFIAAMAMVLPWKIAEDFQSFVKNTNFWPSLWKSVSCKKTGFKEITLVLFESLFQGLHILFYNIFGQTINWSTAKPWTSPKRTFKWPWRIKVSSTRLKFRLCASLKTCDLQIWGNA